MCVKNVDAGATVANQMDSPETGFIDTVDGDRPQRSVTSETINGSLGSQGRQMGSSMGRIFFCKLAFRPASKMANTNNAHSRN